MTISAINESIVVILTTVRQSKADLIVIAALIVLLVCKEMVRAYGGIHTEKWMRWSNWAIAPLLFLFALFVILYVANIITLV